MKIIVDIDGTIAHRGERSPYDLTKVLEDKEDFIITSLIEELSSAKCPPDVVIVSGRDEVCRQDTEKWLNKHNIKYSALYMREHKDNRDDTIVKKELYEKYIKEEDNPVWFVLDDRDKVVKMWRELGLKCLQVAEGNF